MPEAGTTMRDVDHTKLNAHDLARHAIDAERVRQDRKWGVQDHDHFMWNTILMEEVGELSEAILDLYNVIGKSDAGVASALGHLEDELIQVGAVAVAWLENLHRRKAGQEKK